MLGSFGESFATDQLHESVDTVRLEVWELRYVLSYWIHEYYCEAECKKLQSIAKHHSHGKHGLAGTVPRGRRTGDQKHPCPEVRPNNIKNLNCWPSQRQKLM